MAAFVELRRAEKEFGVDGLMMAVNTRNGVYGYLSVLNESGNLLERWLQTERDSLHKRYTVTAPSSAALILQIWLHTICLWKRRCLSRKVEQRIVHANGEQESVKDVRECLNTSKQTIVDLKKGIVVYVNDGAGKRAFAGSVCSNLSAAGIPAPAKRQGRLCPTHDRSLQEAEPGKGNHSDCQAGNLPEYGRFPAREILSRKRCAHDAEMQRYRVSAGKDVPVDGEETLGFFPAGQEHRHRVSGRATLLPLRQR